MKILKLFAFLCLSAAVANGCAILVVDSQDNAPETLASHAELIATEVEVCLQHLNEPSPANWQKLDAAAIHLISWNVKKGGRALWRYDLEDMKHGTNLVLIQEAALPQGDYEAESVMDYWSFAPGYRSPAQLTGVMTYSGAPPLVQCNLTSQEPWLGTPKATGITEYALTGTDETLVVINIHAINFTFGVSDFSAQLEQVRPVLDAHAGPIIFSGDFNTWRGRRARILQDFAADFGLAPVKFETDFRTTFFSHHLDHIYVRGLQVASSGTRAVTSSDHNPLFAELRL